MITIQFLVIIIDRDRKFHDSHSWGTDFGGNQKGYLQRKKKEERHHTSLCSMMTIQCLVIIIIIDRDRKFHDSRSWGTHFGCNQGYLQRTKKEERYHTSRIDRNLPDPSNQERGSCERSRTCYFGNKMARRIVLQLQNGSDRCCPRSVMLSFDKLCLPCYVRDRMCSRHGASFFLRFHLRFG
jgi:hypothetical protein